MISNPTSGHNRSQFHAIQQRINRCTPIHHIVTHSAQDIDAALQALAARNVSVLAINGGDGTSSAILGRLLESTPFTRPPMIALLPGGTANMNAGDIGIKGSLKEAVSSFCNWCEQRDTTTANTQQRSLLRVQLGDIVQHSMFLGGGAIIHGTEYAHREIHSRGLRDDFSLILGTLRTVWGVVRNDPQFNRHISIGLQLDDAPEEQIDTLILAVSTLQRLSFGMRPFWSDAPGAIQVTVMEQGCTKFGRTFLSIIRGKPNNNALPESGYHSHNANRIELTLTGPLNMDGEIVHCDGLVSITPTEPLAFLQL